ncbi:hypothetical protein CYMTET_54190 [Cymbomonas tetramitiformis]|uniref:Endonuclease/exonuclease/phosphatase domain-containing protein n=1 Tax=Cymbomonas tetramitiformis TaxID=36881 RepID=A0AAE0BFG9_9CHLO|nr:hypothetical protein CYMTET_54190 [Cymbomonas tetramitiformis]
MREEGDTQAAMLSMRARLGQMALPIVMRGNTDTGGPVRPGEMEITCVANTERSTKGPQQPLCGSDQDDEDALIGREGRKRTNNEKEATEENAEKVDERTDQWATQKKAKYAPQETIITALLPRWDATQTTKGCQQDTDSEMRERGTEEENEGTLGTPMEEQGAERTVKETTRQEKATQKKGTDQAGGNQPTPYRGKIYQTEPRDEGSNREDSLNMLTWNIGGRRDAGYDICHMLEQKRERQEEDVHVIVLTEVKTAHRDMMNKFSDMGYTAVGTEVANAQERKGAEQTRARGGVVTLLGGPRGHEDKHDSGVCKEQEHRQMDSTNGA